MTEDITALVARHVEDAEARTRASILTFLTAERDERLREYDEHTANTRPPLDCTGARSVYDSTTERLYAKFSILRTMVSCIARGDDKVPR